MDTFTPGQQPPPVVPLDLTQSKTLGPLISSSLRIWLPRPAVFVLSAIILIVPLELLFYGVLGHGFQRDDGAIDPWADYTWTFVGSTLMTALVTATHARAVVALSEGQTVTALSALRTGFGGYWLVLAAGVVYALASLAGLLAVVIGSVFVLVACGFTPQIAALERLGPVQSLTASYRLVMAVGWWRTAGYMLVTGVLASIMGGVVGIAVGALTLIGGSENLGPFIITAMALFNAVILSFSALVTTLLYFSWTARRNALTHADADQADGKPRFEPPSRP